MAKVSIVNTDTVMRRIKDYAVIGLVGLTVWNAPSAVGRINSYLEYSQNRKKITSFIEKGRFDAASELLEAYEEHKTLTDSDMAILKVELKEARREQEEAEKRRLSEKTAEKNASDKNSRMKNSSLEEIF